MRAFLRRLILGKRLVSVEDRTDAAVARSLEQEARSRRIRQRLDTAIEAAQNDSDRLKEWR